MNNRYNFIFVTLTYGASDDLREFLDSVKKEIKNTYKVIVVNSFYDNKSREEIKNIALNNACDFLNVPNRGYGAGNNIGINYAKENYDFDFIVICNPDITIKKFDYKNLLKYSNAVIAPIILARNGKNQNPYWVYENKLSEKFIYLGYKKNLKVISYLGFGINKLIRELFLIFNRKKTKIIYAAHGSFVIFGKNVINKFDSLYDENMFLFAEEAYLAHILKKQCINTYLFPNIIINHKEDASMKYINGKEYKYLKESILYYYENYVKSL